MTSINCGVSGLLRNPLLGVTRLFVQKAFLTNSAGLCLHFSFPPVRHHCRSKTLVGTVGKGKGPLGRGAGAQAAWHWPQGGAQNGVFWRSGFLLHSVPFPPSSCGFLMPLPCLGHICVPWGDGGVTAGETECCSDGPQVSSLPCVLSIHTGYTLTHTPWEGQGLPPRSHAEEHDDAGEEASGPPTCRWHGLLTEFALWPGRTMWRFSR